MIVEIISTDEHTEEEHIYFHRQLKQFLDKNAKIRNYQVFIDRIPHFESSMQEIRELDDK